MLIEQAVCVSPFSILCASCDQQIQVPRAAEGDSIECSTCAHSYQLDGGILVVDDHVTDDMPSEFYPLLATVEPRHFWFGARNRIILSALRTVLGSLAGRSVLDIGCGTGFVMAALERAGMDVCGIDMHIEGLRYARERVRGALACGAVSRLRFDGRFDVAMLCDVIEHVSDDVTLLRQASRALREHGTLVVTVPAHPAFWTTLDDLSGHKRRYTRGSLIDSMNRAGLRVQLVRYFNALLLPVQLLQRIGMKNHSLATAEDRQRLARKALRIPPPPLNALLALGMAADDVLGRLPLTTGTSLIAIGRRS